MVLKRLRFGKHALLGALAVVTAGLSATASAQSPEEIVEFNFPAQSLEQALKDFGVTADRQLMFATNLAEGKTAKSLSGEMEPMRALDALLDGTGLVYEITSSNVILVKAAVAEEVAQDSGNVTPPPSPILTAQTPTNDSDAYRDAAGKPAPEELEEIIVTGSKLISDPGKLTRQITVFRRDEIERSGATRLDEFLARLPQNLNAPNNVGAGFAPAAFGEPTFGLGDNMFAGSSINLRGLGSQYTLILINGRRPARGGQFGTITDISNIPIDRIERIEVLFDGAAAVYGADAVGGVVNIITNRRYNGTSVTAAYSDTNDGGGARYNLQLGHTFSWDSGSLTASVSYQTQEQIDGSQRPGIALENSSPGIVGADLFLSPSVNGNVRGGRRFALVDGALVTNFAPLMWVNGDQRLSGGVEVPALQLVVTGSGTEFVETTTIVDRQNPVLPPGYFWIDETAHRPQNPETLGFTPVFQADLPQYDDQPLAIGDVSASGELGEDVFVPFEGLAISPEDETYSIGLHFVQDFTEALSLNLSLDYSETQKASNNLGNDSLTLLQADVPSNPFLQTFEFAFQNVFPQQFQKVDVVGYNISGGIDWAFAEDWSLAVGFGVSEQKSDSETMNFLRKSGSGPDNLDARLRGYYFTLPGQRQFTGSHFNDPLLGYGSVEEMTEALVVPFIHTHNYSESYDADIRLMGKLFGLPGGDVRSSLSLRYREDRVEVFDNSPLASTNFRSPLDVDAQDYEDRYGEHVVSIGTELSVPVFGDDFRLPLVDRLLLSLSGSLEDYSNTDENGFNWAAGFNWGLSQDFVIRLNRTYSLKVPDSVRTAREPRWVRSMFFQVYNDINDTVPFQVNEPLWRIRGGANHLVPERNYGTAISFIYRPSFAEGLDIQLNVTESNTVDQLGNPWMGKWTLDTLTPEAVAGNPLFAFGDPENNPFHAVATAPQIDPVTGQPLSEPATIQPGDLVFDAREYNVGNTFNRGADLQVRYNLDTGLGNWLFTWRHQYLDVNRVTRSNLCEQVEAGCTHTTALAGDRGYGEPIDTVESVSRDNFANLFPLPRNRGSVELYWGYRGLGVNLSTQYQETTSVFKTDTLVEQVIVDYFEFNGILIPIFEEQTRTNIFREDSAPARALDLTLSYDFGEGDLFKAPRWLENARIWLTVDRLYSEERKQTVTYLQQEFDVPGGLAIADINRLSINPRGRAYSLRFSNTF